MANTTLNTLPIYIGTPDIQLGAGAVVGPSANTATDGTGANTYLIFTAGASGSYVYKVILKAIGTTAATVARVFYCSATGAFSAGTTNTAANTTMIAELTLAAWTASNTTASPQYEIPINFPIQASTKLLVTFGTSTGSAGNGFNPLTIAGDY
jgi:hypothetical protein